MRSNNSYTKLVMILAAVGALVSVKLLWIHIRFTSGLAGFTESCGIGGSTGCIDVALSKYSAILGIPLASIALGTYLALIVLGFLAQRPQGGKEPAYVMFLLSTVSIVVTVTMFVISNYILGQFCAWCAMLWVVNLAIWPLLMLQLGLGWGNPFAGLGELAGGGKENLQKNRVSSALITAVACVAVATLGSVVVKAGSSTQSGPSTLVADYEAAPIVMLPKEAYGGPTAKGFSGDGAPVMEIAELADFECPACKMAGMALRTFMLKNKDKVRLTFRNFPLDGSCNPGVQHGPHRNACAAAKGGICAANQGKFWAYHDQVFDRQSEISESVLKEIAGTSGLDVATWEACLKDSATEVTLQKDMQLGEMISLQSTPTLVINGHKMIGGRSPSDLDALLEHLVSQQKK